MSSRQANRKQRKIRNELLEKFEAISVTIDWRALAGYEFGKPH